ncbi:MAG: ATP-dependent protease ATPase subunit HslU [Christensenellales bacterium]
MELSPKQIVEELDKYIIGQTNAKKAVAIAIRNRYRRSKLTPELREEITPKNIIMKGPTGVGKTEIARRLARLIKAPFIKVEATKYTEVGYVGRDVESMIRDLVDVSIRMVKDEMTELVKEKAKASVDKTIIDAIFAAKKATATEGDLTELKNAITLDYNNGKYEDFIIELDIEESPKPMGIMDGAIAEINIGGMFESIFPKSKRRKKMSVKNARKTLIEIECDKLIDNDKVNTEAIRRAEESGIIFIDEMDKILDKGQSNGPNVSREGVQRDILPIVEGCTVNTKYGTIKTDYILFIAAGAFHVSKIEDMIPELQGRFPIKVELDNLTKDDFIKILTLPKNAITLQYKELLKVDNIDINFTNDALTEIAEISEQENETSENIGARRLHAVMEKVLEDVSYNANGLHPMLEVVIDKNFVQNTLKDAKKKFDLTKYVL